MKKILFLLLLTVAGYGQTLQNPTFGNTTTNTLKIKTPATVTSVNFLTAIDSDGLISKAIPKSSIIVNDSGVIGSSVSDALSALNTNKANDSNTVHKVGDTFSNSTDFDPLLSQDPTTLNINKRNLKPESSRLPIAHTDVYCWGDSFFGGAGGATKIPDQMVVASKFNIVNKGVGGETSTQIKDRLVADVANYSKSVIIWAGRNNFNSPATVKADIATMVSTIGHTRYLVVSIFNGDSASEWIGGADYNTIKQLNADLKAIYGSKYVEARDYIVSLHNNSAQDLIDFSHDVSPVSLRNTGDPLHLNSTGNSLVSDLLISKLGTLFEREGYLQSKDFKYYFENNLPLHTYGDETVTGIKTFTNPVGTSRNTGLTFTNNGSGSTNSSVLFTNMSTGIGYSSDNRSTGYGIFNSNSAGGRGIYSINTSSGYGFFTTNSAGGLGYYSSNASYGTGIRSDNSSSGVGIYSNNSGTGIGCFAQNTSTGVLNTYNSTTSSTGDLLQFTKNGVVTTKFDQNGVRTIVNPPTTSAGGYEFYTRNTTTGIEEKVPSANVATTASVALKADIASPTFTGDLSLGMNPTGSTQNKLKQVIGLSDYWSIYGSSATEDRSELVFEVGDNGESYSGIGERFRFSYTNIGGGSAKDVAIIDYDKTNINASLSVGSLSAPTARLNLFGGLGGVVGSGMTAIKMTDSDTGDYASISSGIVGVSNSGMEMSINGISRATFSGTGVFNVNNLSGTGTRTVVADASGNLSATDIAPTSGTYTPTVAGSSSLSGANVVYSVIGKIMTLTLAGNITFTSGNISSSTINLPTGYTLSTTNQPSGKSLGTGGLSTTNIAAASGNRAGCYVTSTPNSNLISVYSTGNYTETISTSITFQVLVN